MTKTTSSYTGSKVEDFGVVDAKGRKIGSSVRLETIVRVEAADGTNSLPAGTTYAYRPSATRDGNVYGAYNYGKTYATEAERDQGVVTYFKAARAEKVSL
jgi:hypothetical protein